MGECNLGFAYFSDDKCFQGYAEMSTCGLSDGNTVETSAAYMSYHWKGGGPHSWLPGFTGALELAFGNVVIHPWAHVGRLKWDGGEEEDDSYYSPDMGLEAGDEFGLAGFSVGVNYGLDTAQNRVLVSGDPLVIDNVVDSNVEQLGLWGELRVGGLALGGSYAFARRDGWTEDPNAAAAYANYSIEFGKITFIPEVSWLNHGQDEAGQTWGASSSSDYGPRRSSDKPSGPEYPSPGPRIWQMIEVSSKGDSLRLLDPFFCICC